MTGCGRGAGLAGWLVGALARLPLPAAHALGTLVGWLVASVPNRYRSITRRNLALCFPGLSEPERQRLARRSLIETGKTLFETPLTWCRAPEEVFALVRDIEGEAVVRSATAEGRGVIIAGPHLGAWEIGGLYVGAAFRSTTLYRPPHIRSLDHMIRVSRERTGADLVATDGAGVRALFRRLARGEVVSILPDQDPGGTGGAYAPFFGIQTNTMTLLGRLAAKTDALVVVGFAERLPRAGGFHLHMVPVEDEAIRSADPAQAAAALNRAVEALVRRCPEQYQWSYKRFRRRPPGEPKLY